MDMRVSQIEMLIVSYALERKLQKNIKLLIFVEINCV